jgi:hypothetical protein
MSTSDISRDFAAFGDQVDRFEAEYQDFAQTKSGIQKGLDSLRSGFDGGYGDDQYRNIGETRHMLVELEHDVSSGRIDDAQAAHQLRGIQRGFESEAQRVHDAQKENAEFGATLHALARNAAVSFAGAAASGVGGPAGGAAAGIAVGNLFDLATVAATEFDEARGNGPRGGQPSHFTAQLDTTGSVLGLTAEAVVNDLEVTEADLAHAFKGTVRDGANGAVSAYLKGQAADAPDPQTLDDVLMARAATKEAKGRVMDRVEETLSSSTVLNPEDFRSAQGASGWQGADDSMLWALESGQFA